MAEPTSASDTVTVPPIAWKTLACVSLVSFMVSVELTIISLALEDIRGAFSDASEAQLSWIFTAYNIGVAALLLPAAWMADRFGRRVVFVTGVALFGIGSLLAGLSQSIEMLIATRALQSIGGAFQFPAGLALLLAAFPVERRQMGIGIWGATGGLAAAVGPTLGAVLVNSVGWRAVFLVNVPVALVITLLGGRWLTRSDADDVQPGADLISVPLAAIGVGSIIFGITQTERWGWSDGRIWFAIALGVALLAIFLWRSNRHKSPLFDLSLFRLRSFAIGSLGQTAFVAAFFAWLVPLPTFIRQTWNWSVLETGFAIAPGPVMAMVVAPVAGRFADRVGPARPLAVGGAAGALGGLCHLLFTSTEPDYVLGVLVPGLLIGVAAGTGFSGSVGAIMRDVPPRLYSMGGAARQTLFQLALALAIAVVFTIIARPESPAAHLDAMQTSWAMILGLFAAEAVLFGVIYPNDGSPAAD